MKKRFSFSNYQETLHGIPVEASFFLLSYSSRASRQWLCFNYADSVLQIGDYVSSCFSFYSGNFFKAKSFKFIVTFLRVLKLFTMLSSNFFHVSKSLSPLAVYYGFIAIMRPIVKTLNTIKVTNITAIYEKSVQKISNMSWDQCIGFISIYYIYFYKQKRV